MHRKRLAVALPIVVLVTALAISIAHAELTERGDLFVRFRGGISPTALPRRHRAPIAISVDGTVKTLSGQRPPALRKIKIELSKGGRLNAYGLPVCRYGDLVAASPAKVLNACGGALVGDGSYDARTAFPEQETFPSHGHILAFNGLYEGHEVILAHVYGANLVPVTRVIVFHIHRRGGIYGTVITGALPVTVNRYGYVVGIALRLHRRYVYRGRRRSYLSAACDAPDGFTVATFPFARAAMTFADSRTLSGTLTRSCKVSG